MMGGTHGSRLQDQMSLLIPPIHTQNKDEANELTSLISPRNSLHYNLKSVADSNLNSRTASRICSNEDNAKGRPLTGRHFVI